MDDLFDSYVKSILSGILANGADSSYDTIHRAMTMAKYVLEIRKQYME